MNNPSQSFNIHHDLHISVSRKEVFGAVSLPEHLINWWILKCTGKPEIGTEYNFYFSPQYNWYGKVIKCEYETSFHIKMTK